MGLSTTLNKAVTTRTIVPSTNATITIERVTFNLAAGVMIVKYAEGDDPITIPLTNAEQAAVLTRVTTFLNNHL